MRQVDYIDYGLGWEKLKRGESGDTVCFEIVDFEVLCPIEQIAFEERWERKQKRIDAEIMRARARSKMRNRIKRIIMGNRIRKLYWLPGLVHARLSLSMLAVISSHSRLKMNILEPLSTIEARLGLYVMSLVCSYCLRTESRK